MMDNNNSGVSPANAAAASKRSTSEVDVAFELDRVRDMKRRMQLELSKGTRERADIRVRSNLVGAGVNNNSNNANANFNFHQQTPLSASSGGSRRVVVVAPRSFGTSNGNPDAASLVSPAGEFEPTSPTMASIVTELPQSERGGSRLEPGGGSAFLDGSISNVAENDVFGSVNFEDDDDDDDGATSAASMLRHRLARAHNRQLHQQQQQVLGDVGNGGAGTSGDAGDNASTMTEPPTSEQPNTSSLLGGKFGSDATLITVSTTGAGGGIRSDVAELNESSRMSSMTRLEQQVTAGEVEDDPVDNDDGDENERVSTVNTEPPGSEVSMPPSLSNGVMAAARGGAVVLEGQETDAHGAPALTAHNINTASQSVGANVLDGRSMLSDPSMRATDGDVESERESIATPALASTTTGAYDVTTIADSVAGDDGVSVMVEAPNSESSQRASTRTPSPQASTATPSLSRPVAVPSSSNANDAGHSTLVSSVLQGYLSRTGNTALCYICGRDECLTTYPAHVEGCERSFRESVAHHPVDSIVRRPATAVPTTGDVVSVQRYNAEALQIAKEVESVRVKHNIPRPSHHRPVSRIE
eukprot:PhM_4_TR18656/c0_g1_i1/m.75821